MSYTTVMILLAIAGGAATILRSLSAGSEYKKESEQKQSAEEKLKKKIVDQGISSKEMVCTECVCMALAAPDESSALLTYATDTEMETIDLKDAAVIDLEDQTEHFKSVLEKEQYHCGMRRASIYAKQPYSTRELREGHTAFEALKGTSLMTLQIRMKDGSEKKIPCLKAPYTPLWGKEAETAQNILFFSNACRTWLAKQKM